MEAKTIVFFAGLPGSGKTTICQRMAELTRVPYIDIDDFKRRVVDPNEVTEGVDPPDLRMTYCRLALGEAFRSFKKGASTVIMDEVFPFHSVRSELERVSKERGARVLWIQVRAQREVALARLSNLRAGHILSQEQAEKIYKMCARSFEPFPEGSLNHFVLENGNGCDIDYLVEVSRRWLYDSTN